METSIDFKKEYFELEKKHVNLTRAYNEIRALFIKDDCGHVVLKDNDKFSIDVNTNTDNEF